MTVTIKKIGAVHQNRLHRILRSSLDSLSPKAQHQTAAGRWFFWTFELVAGCHFLIIPNCIANGSGQSCLSRMCKGPEWGDQSTGWNMHVYNYTNICLKPPVSTLLFKLLIVTPSGRFSSPSCQRPCWRRRRSPRDLHWWNNEENGLPGDQLNCWKKRHQFGRKKWTKFADFTYYNFFFRTKLRLLISKVFVGVVHHQPCLVSLACSRNAFKPWAHFRSKEMWISTKKTLDLTWFDQQKMWIYSFTVSKCIKYQYQPEPASIFQKKHLLPPTSSLAESFLWDCQGSPRKGRNSPKKKQKKRKNTKKYVLKKNRKYNRQQKCSKSLWKSKHEIQNQYFKNQ